MPTIRDAVIENAARAEAQRLTPEQLSALLKVTVASVYECMSRLRRAGRLAPSSRQVTRAVLPMVNGSELRPSLPLGGASPEALFEVLQRGDVLSVDQRLKLASHLAKTAPGPVAVGALKLLAVDLDPVTPGRVGPLDPLTDAEWDERLGSLILAAGPKRHERAIRWAELRREAAKREGPPSPVPREG